MFYDSELRGEIDGYWAWCHMSACHLSSSEVMANTLGVLVHHEFEASLDYLSPCAKKKKNRIGFLD